MWVSVLYVYIHCASFPLFSFSLLPAHYFSFSLLNMHSEVCNAKLVDWRCHYILSITYRKLCIRRQINKKTPNCISHNRIIDICIHAFVTHAPRIGTTMTEKFLKFYISQNNLRSFSLNLFLSLFLSPPFSFLFLCHSHCNIQHT